MAPAANANAYGKIGSASLQMKERKDCGGVVKCKKNKQFILK
jgi:hypothetical protein